jgi:quercetin dioxygenase-like cupin family protein
MGERVPDDFDWGSMDWLYESGIHDPASGSSVGIQTIAPREKQAVHYHHGDECIVCVLSGTGRHCIDGEERRVAPGSVFHIAVGAQHEEENTGDEPLRELIVSIPATGEAPIPYEGMHVDAGLFQADLLDRIERSPELAGMFSRFSATHILPVAFFNAAGRAVIRAKRFPEPCRKCRKSGNGDVRCALYDIKDSYTEPQYTAPAIFMCPQGVSGILCTVEYGGRMLGMIKGGHMPLFPEDLPKLRGGNDAVLLKSARHGCSETI